MIMGKLKPRSDKSIDIYLSASKYHRLVTDKNIINKPRAYLPTFSNIVGADDLPLRIVVGVIQQFLHYFVLFEGFSKNVQHA